MDGLKEKLHIKDIVNNLQIFKEFDVHYKNMGKIQDEKIQKKFVIL